MNWIIVGFFGLMALEVVGKVCKGINDIMKPDEATTTTTTIQYHTPEQVEALQAMQDRKDQAGIQ